MREYTPPRSCATVVIETMGQKTKASPVTASLSPAASAATPEVETGRANRQAQYGNAFLQQQMPGPQQDEHGHGDGHEQEGGHGQEAGTDVAPDAEVGRRRAGAPRTKAAALARHARNQERLTRIMDSALSVQPDVSGGINSRPNLLRNTAQWIESGEATLVALTPTHDSHKRPSVAADKSAFFDQDVDYKSSGATYDSSVNRRGEATNDDGLSIKFSNVGGSMSNDGQRLTIVDPLSESEGTIATFLIHEVQHDADQHRTGEAWEVPQPAAAPGGTDRAPQWVYNSYQTEFRAYWLMSKEGGSADPFGLSTDTAVTNFDINVAQPGPDGVYGTADDTVVTATTAFGNVRQQSIFGHMYQGGRPDNTYYDGTNWTQSYGYLPYYYGLDPAFKAMVDAYTHPASGNAINSPRIQALSTALTASSLPDALIAAVELDDLDRRYLQDRTQTQPFWDQLNASTFGFMIEAILTSMIDVPVLTVGQQEEVDVQKGDTLSAIADRYLHEPSRWPEIYRLNRAVVGNNPDKLTVGSKLRLPAI